MDKQKLGLVLNEIKTAPVVRRPKGNPGGRDLYYADVIAAFDIETSIDQETNQAFMYAFGFGVNDKYVEGRTWGDFLEIMKGAQKAAQGAAVPVYVHNLSYEFVYLSGILDFAPGAVLCGKEREVIKAFCPPFEFRCSYKLTGLSLETLTNEYDVIHKKLSGDDFDYYKIRYPWTRLNRYEHEYLYNDVMGLIESVKKIMGIYKDTIYTIPITKTGYIRRQLKRRMRTYPWEYVNQQKINIDIYKLLNAAMRGGNAHANRYFAGEVIPEVDSWDISSAYPAAIVYGKFPMGAWRFEEKPTIDALIQNIYVRKRAVLAAVRFKNIRLKNKYEPFPYISASKSDIGIDKIVGLDNGRVLYAKSMLLGVYTDIDLKIIFEQYDFDDIEILQFCSTKYRPLPDQIRDYVLELYQQKTKLKGTGKKELYTATKTELNGMFGMLAEDPGKIYKMYTDGVFIPEDITKEEAVLRKIEKSNISYAWGIWVPAIVRSWVQGVLNELGDNALYVDTDGIKVANGAKVPFENFNAKIDDLAAQTPGATAIDSEGVIHTLGAWEYEGRFGGFVTLGVKKYAYSVKRHIKRPKLKKICKIKDKKFNFEPKKGYSIKIATAGVNKKKGGRELGTLDNYKEGFTFYEAAGREAIYNDFVDMEIEREGHKLHITRNVVLKPSSFTLGMTEEYKRIIGLMSFIERVKQ